MLFLIFVDISFSSFLSLFVFFFFSSRRRHTRYWRDWSSDVCSSDLIREAPWFYAYYFFDLVLAGTVVLIPRAPLVLITLFVQVIATTLLPAALVFLILLLNDKKTMGKYRNSTWQNVANISIDLWIIVLSTMYGVITLFPGVLE